MKAPKLLRRRSTTLIVGTCNIGRGVSVQTARKAFLLVLRTALMALHGLKVRAGMTIGFQEIDESDRPDEHGMLHQIAADMFRRVRWVGWNTAVPMSVPPGWRVVRSWVRTASSGAAGISPTRYVVAALLEHKATGIRIWRDNGHLAHPPHADDHSQELHDRGVALREAGNDRWADDVNEQLEDGYVVITTRDPNGAKGRLSDPKLATELVFGTELDEIRVIIPKTADVAVTVGRKRIWADPHVDKHHLEAREVTITRKAA